MVESGYDVGQICENGHVVNASSLSYPEHNESFCSRCGAETVAACPKCEAPVRGHYYVPGVVNFSGSYEPPSFCHACGGPYPWTRRKLEAGAELVQEMDNLSDDEKDLLRKSIDDLVVDSPKTKLAATRTKRLLGKAGSSVAGVFRDLIVDIASETAKKLLWPD